MIIRIFLESSPFEIWGAVGGLPKGPCTLYFEGDGNIFQNLTLRRDNKRNKFRLGLKSSLSCFFRWSNFEKWQTNY